MGTTTTALGSPAATKPVHRLGFGGVLRSEWVKLRSVRSSGLTVLGAALMMLVTGLIFASTVGSDSDGANGVTDPTGITLSGVMFAQLVIGVLGVLVVSGEYSTGMIRSTLTGVPSRLPVLAGKVAVVVGAVFPTMLASAFAVFLSGQLVMGNAGLPTARLGDPGVLAALFGSAATMTGVTVIGVALGAVMRNTAGAISTLVVLVFLAPGLGGLLLPASWRDDALKYLPSRAAEAFTTVVPAPGLLTASTGVAVFAVWVVVPLILAAVLLHRRDA
ncbi:ABC transporter permease subunit [Umezawaea tangerina]|uniref:ABC-type transport system involved in multi-copper enzyme maturation permease subunit n=1 Tax=Umezawaea tangerina TaxID=84725 RepID=A0A2T0TGI4_9PSEU|nr:ABC transporter permease subunit [Umezawaea tangerina]PRY44733.1 ABC-type transport system involved in multi-copper enzyme maturation permease subunit [Umezawaea tangerina]